MNADGTNVIRLADDRFYGTTPAWSPDGRRIAFVSHRYGNAHIWVMNADGTHVVRLTNNGARDSGPTWGP